VQSGPPESQELNGSLASIAKILIGQETVHSTLARIAQIAVRLVEGADFGCVSLVKGDDIETVGATDELAIRIDDIQYETGEGPCLSSIRERTTYRIDDMSKDTKWPNFSHRAASLGAGGLLAFVLDVDGSDGASLGALNLYARSPNAFTEEGRTLGAIFASQAAVALANAQTHARDLERLEKALASRDVIGQAQGILMSQEGLSADEAFARLRRASQGLNQKLRDVARDVVRQAGGPAAGLVAERPSRPSPARG
jgi:GAF domain-containing protein